MPFLSSRIIDHNKMHGTPFFVYDLDAVRTSARRITDQLGNSAHVHYCMKANPDHKIVQTMKEENLGIEVSTIGELHTAIKLGFSPDKIIVTGPGKTADELLEITRCKPKYLILESVSQAKLASSLVPSGECQSVLVRISPSAKAYSAQFGSPGFAMFGGKPIKFGIDEEDAVEAIRFIHELPSLEIHGVHVFSASGVLDAASLLEYYQYVKVLCEMLERESGIMLNIIDFGGGLGVDQSGQTGIDDVFLFSKMRDMFTLLKKTATQQL